MTTFNPSTVSKAVAELAPLRSRKFQVVEKVLPAVTNARIVPLRCTSRVLVTSLDFQDCNKSGELPSALGGGALRSGSDSLNAALRPPLHLPRSPTSDRSQTIRINRPGDGFVNQRLANSDFPIPDCKIGAIRHSGWCVNKSSGLEMRLKNYLRGVDSGALASSSVWLACACQGCPKNEPGAVRRWFGLRLHR
jgi:hypothetical protein